MQKAAILSAFLYLLVSGCQSEPYTSSLAVFDSGEPQWSRDLCDAKVSAARISRVSINGIDMVFVAGDYCQAVNKAKKAKSKKQLGLVDSEPRKPVMILYGYGGNGDGDKMVHNAISDTKPWANENFRVVQIPPGADLAKTSTIINQDRARNPQDYGPDAWVGSIVAGHGYIADDGRHKTVKTDISNKKIDPNQIGPTTTYTSNNTLDVQRTILNSIGNNAGTVMCSVYECQSGAVKNDPEFQSITTNPYNPNQKRIFQFSAAADRLAKTSPSISPEGYINSATTIEQSVGFLMQQGQSSGLTVEEYNKRLQAANLGTFQGLDIQTAYVPGSSSDVNPLGTPSHDVVTPLFTSQGPSVVGPKDAYILPPGVTPDQNHPKIATQQDQINAATAGAPPGTTINQPVEVPD